MTRAARKRAVPAPPPIAQPPDAAMQPQAERPPLTLRFDDRLTVAAIITYTVADSSPSRLMALLTEYGGLEPGVLDDYDVSEFRALEIMLYRALIEYAETQTLPFAVTTRTLGALSQLEQDRLYPARVARWYVQHADVTHADLLRLPAYLVIAPLPLVGKALGVDWLK